MKKIMALMIVMSFLSVSCNKSGGSTGSTPSTTPVSESLSDATAPAATSTTTATSSPTPSSNSNVPAQALSFQTNVELLSFTAAQTDKYNQAVAMVKKVVATEQFETAILNYTWNGAQQFANNNGLTNAQIYQSILDAAETLQPAKNNTMDLGVKLYYEASTIIGYTNGSITYINVNTKFFDQFAINDVAGNLFHEWLHKLGYVHDFASTPQRPYSVPYAVGYLVRDIGKSFL
jgi:hypothetical protein